MNYLQQTTGSKSCTSYINSIWLFHLSFESHCHCIAQSFNLKRNFYRKHLFLLKFNSKLNLFACSHLCNYLFAIQYHRYLNYTRYRLNCMWILIWFFFANFWDLEQVNRGSTRVCRHVVHVEILFEGFTTGMYPQPLSISNNSHREQQVTW